MNNKLKPGYDPEVQIEAALTKSEQFLEKNTKKIIYTIVAITILVAIFFGYKYFVQAPAEKSALNDSFTAQQYFLQDSLSLALNGDGDKMGFLQLIEKYSSTETGNTAAHYAGICLLRLGQPEKALEMFKSYKEVKGTSAMVINAQNIGLMGDCYSQLKDYKNALDYYIKATKIENSLTAPAYLKKAGLVYFTQGDNAKALECYEIIKNKYFNSIEARDIDKHIGQCVK